MGGPLPGISEPLKNPNGGYARSIHILKLGPFQYEIASDAQIAEFIENGTQELDMKKTHPYGPRSRVSKKGVPYLIIPFRWGTPAGRNGKRVGFRNTMPDAVYKIVKNKQKFRQTKTLMSTHIEPNAHGQPVARNEYKGADGKGGWGDRLMDIDANMEGMSSMLGQDGKASGYFTFRVISAKSPKHSWIKPAMKARPVTKAVADSTEKEIEELVDSAIREDLNV
jgi:hypothetical protein